MKVNDLSGRRFHSLVVISRVGISADGRATWLVRCDCGREKTLNGSAVQKAKSCGCQNGVFTRAASVTHGRASGGVVADGYNAWRGMIHRCHDPRSSRYLLYGARGISVCERWRESIDSFLGDMGHRPSKKHSVDRINNNGNYEPGNCRWATQQQQMRNNRRNSLVTCDGVTATLAEWSDRTGISYRTLTMRKNLGWTGEQIIHAPIRQNKKLDEFAVSEIRKERAAGTTRAALARRFGISPRAILCIDNRETCKHVA